MAEADPRTLQKFTVTPGEDGMGFRLHIEDESGEVMEVSATRDQLEVLTDALDEALAETETAAGDPDASDEDED